VILPAAMRTAPRARAALLLAALALACASLASAFKDAEMKKCSDLYFCRRHARRSWRCETTPAAEKCERAAADASATRLRTRAQQP
jgi:hypothetical protein